MSWYRIYATMIDDGEHNPDKDTFIVLQVKLDENHQVNPKAQAFGYTREWDEESGAYSKYPFILDYRSQSRIAGKMNYGGWDTESDNHLNIYDKAIKENELFTWFEDLESTSEQVIYRIDKVSTI